MFLVFLLFETFALFLFFQHNTFQRSKLAAFSRNISGVYHKKTNSVIQYLSLKKANDELIKENEQLKNLLVKYLQVATVTSPKYAHPDTQYTYTYCKVVNNSTNKQYNYITLNKGSMHNIKPEMAVISNNGIVGIVKGVSEKYTTVLSVLNRKFKTSAKIKKNGYYGSLEWQGHNYKQAVLKEIPHHVDISVGDTIITSGYSAIFPEGILIGFASDFELVEGNFYQIKVNLSTDFKNLSYVYVIENKLKDDQLEIETSTLKNEF